MADDSAVSRLARSPLMLPLFGLAGLLLVLFPAVGNGHIPGDLGDARFNSYVLEHLYRYVIGQDANFWTADFFYPFPLTTALSDNHLGTGLFYAGFRAAGLDREDAFRAWFAFGYGLNYAAAAYVLVRMGYSSFAAAAGAFLFTFGLPVTAQENHAQLVYRFLVPLAVLALLEFRNTRQFRQLVLLACWTTWEFYCSIYLGYFLVLLLLALIITLAIAQKGGPLAGWRAWPSASLGWWRRHSLRARGLLLACVVLLCALMAGLGAPYLEVSHLYHLQRPWGETAALLPRLPSYFLAPLSRFWPTAGALFNALPMRWEHGLFVGAAPFLAVAAAVLLRLFKRSGGDRLFAPLGLAILLLVYLTLWANGHSAYYYLASLPGVNAIRAVSRIIMVLLFPCAMLLAASLDLVIRARVSGWLRAGTGASVAALMIFESSFVVHYVHDKQDWQARMVSVQAELPATTPATPILLLAPVPAESGTRYLRELDAMLFAQDHGWRTLNGYSGSAPPNHAVSGLCQDIPADLGIGLQFRDPTAQLSYASLAHQVLALGYPVCDDTILSERPRWTTYAGPVPTELMAHTQLAIRRVAVFAGRVIITVAITNHASIDLPAGTSTDQPISLSARFVGPQDEAAMLKGAGWDSRQGLVSSVAPGETKVLDIALSPPAAPGVYRVAISMVQDGVEWFHNQGMLIPISSQTIVVDGGVSVVDGTS